MGLRERSIARRERIQSNRATSFAEAERWDLEFWQQQPPEDRLPALAAELAKGSSNGLRKRSIARQRQTRPDLATSFTEAERRDLEFWQQQTPEARLSALVAIRNDMRKVLEARAKQEPPSGDLPPG